MRVLYVTYLWTPLLGKNALNVGMPAFVKPLVEMQKRGWDIDYLLITADENAMEKVTHSDAIHLFPAERIKQIVLCKNKNKIRKLLEYGRFSRELYARTRELLNTEHYDFVYGHSEYAYAALKIANKSGIPCGQRLYGTFLWEYSKQHSWFRSFVSFPLEVLSYNASKSFLLITNDGTGGDYAYQKFALKKDKFRFLFWMNGVNRYQNISLEKQHEFFEKYCIQYPSVFYLARLANWKRQDRAILSVAELSRLGIEAHLYLVGQIGKDDNVWFESLMQLAKKENVEKQVHYLGTMERYQNAIMARNCDFSFVMYDFSCLGNVFHELFADGAVLICIDENDSLKDFVKSGENGFIVKNPFEAAQVMKKILSDPVKSEAIRERAKKDSQRIMESWEKRIDRELEIIMNYVSGK